MRVAIFTFFILFIILPNNLKAQRLSDTLKLDLTSKVDSLINF
jgi:hypothetical protein